MAGNNQAIIWQLILDGRWFEIFKFNGQWFGILPINSAGKGAGLGKGLALPQGSQILQIFLTGLGDGIMQQLVAFSYGPQGRLTLSGG
jgi:hypothetical protein